MARRSSVMAFMVALMCLTFIFASDIVSATSVETDIYRAIMYDRRLGTASSSKGKGKSKSKDGLDGVARGTRAVLLRGNLVPFDASSGSLDAYTHATVYVPCSTHVSPSALRRLSESKVRGVLFALCDDDASNEEAVSMLLSQKRVSFPIYFLPSNSADFNRIEGMLTDTQDVTTDHVIVAAGKNHKDISVYPNITVPTHTIASHLVFRPKELRSAKGADSARVLLTTNFDTMGVAPAATTTAGASGIAAAVDLWRRLTTSAAAAARAMSKDGSKAQTPYGVSMILGSTARFNYVGTTAWIADRKDSDLDRYRLIISLDELLPSAVTRTSTTEESEDGAELDEAEEPSAHGASTVLYMHVLDTFLKRSDGQQWVDLAKKTAAAHGVELKVLPAKTNYQHYDLRFEHEVFANRQLPAVTFSAIRTHHADQIFRGSRYPLTAEAAALLAKRVDFIEAFVRATLNIAPDASMSSSTSSETYIHGLLSHARRSHRSPLAQQGKAQHAYAVELEQHLRQQNSALRMQNVSATSTLSSSRIATPGLAIYGPYEKEVSVAIAKSWSFELLSAGVAVVAVIVFLIVEFGIRGPKRLLLNEDM